MKQKIIFILIAGLVIAGSMYYYTFHKGHESISVQREKSELQVSAQELLHDFLIDETASNEKFGNKVIEVSGILKNVTETSAGYQAVLISKTEKDATVICNFDRLADVKLDTLSIGKQITVKGICTGYLFDVVIDHAILMLSLIHI